MALRRVELVLSSSVGRMFAGAVSGGSLPGVGGGVTWDNLGSLKWDAWDLTWGQ